MNSNKDKAQQWAQSHSSSSRRHFLKCASAMGLVGSSAFIHGLGAKSAIAAESGGYKALVCINLKGGMDHADTLFPVDESEFTALTNIRKELLDSYEFLKTDSSRNRENLLTLGMPGEGSADGRRFGVPKELQEIHAMFNEGEASIVANVGPLLEQTDRISMESGGLIPARLYSHNDQQSTWQSLGTEGARLGWGGGFVDAALASNPTSKALYASISASENSVFLASQTTPQFQLPQRQGKNLKIVDRRALLGSNIRYDNARDLLTAYLSTPDPFQNNLMRQDTAHATASGIKNNAEYQSFLDMVAPITTVFPATSLGAQLAAVAQAIGLRDVLGLPRQVFYVTLSGLDTHSDQSTDLPAKHQELSMAMAAFKKAMVELNAWNDVTAFTMSDFGRTLTANGNGTDHGWGSHHFVMGGSVNGGKIIGNIPEPTLGSARFTKRRARMIPTLSIEQYASNLGSWFGLSNDELNKLFPNLTRFDSAAINLFST